MVGLGIALIPAGIDREATQNLTSSLETKAHPFAFALHKRLDAIPHLSLMQGVFSDPETALAALSELDVATVPSELQVKDVSIWATKIVFLNFELQPRLFELHAKIFASWSAYLGGSADPQIFLGITAGQRLSFEKTGYPFSLAEYLPHITLAHLAEPAATVSETLKAKPMLPHTMRFEKLAIFRVEPLGVCREFLYEWSLES